MIKFLETHFELLILLDKLWIETEDLKKLT